MTARALADLVVDEAAVCRDCRPPHWHDGTRPLCDPPILERVYGRLGPLVWLRRDGTRR